MRCCALHQRIKGLQPRRTRPGRNPLGPRMRFTLRTASAYSADLPWRRATFSSVSRATAPLQVAPMSAPAKMRAAAASVRPCNAAQVSAVDLPQCRLQHPMARRRGIWPDAVPAVGLGVEVGAGGDEHLDHARVAVPCGIHEGGPPATHSANRIGRLAAVRSGAARTRCWSCWRRQRRRR